MKKSENNISTGAFLNNYIQKNRISKSQLGIDINRNGKSITQYLYNSSIQTGILLDICHALKHNFFSDLADQLPMEFTKNQPKTDQITSEKELFIAQLQEENKVLKIQNELLMKLKG